MTPNSYEQYMDVAGMVAQRTVGYEYITVGGLSVLPEASDALRSAAEGLPKWRDSSLDQALTAVRLIDSMVLVALTVRMYKEPKKWAAFWSKAEEYYRSLAQGTRDAKRSAFAKAANIIRYTLFGECSARLMGESVRRLGKPTLQDAEGLSVVQLTIVCDTDIQGEENISTFEYLWERAESSHPLIRSLGLSEQIRNVSFRSEEDEHILVLADHLAGAIHATAAQGSVPRPSRITERELAIISDAYAESSNIVGVTTTFDLNYESIFGDTQLGRVLWSE